MNKTERPTKQLAPRDLGTEGDDRAILEAARLDPDEVIDTGQALIRNLVTAQLATLSSPAGGLAHCQVDPPATDAANLTEDLEEAYATRAAPLLDQLNLNHTGPIQVLLSMEPCLRVEQAEFERVIKELNQAQRQRPITLLEPGSTATGQMPEGTSLFIGVLGWNSCGLPKPEVIAGSPTGHPCSGAVVAWERLGHPPALFLHRLGTHHYEDTDLQDQMVKVDEYIHDQSQSAPTVVQTFCDEEDFSRLLHSALSRNSDDRGEKPLACSAEEEGLSQRLRFVEAAIRGDSELILTVLQPSDTPSGIRLDAAGRRLDALYTKLGQATQWLEPFSTSSSCPDPRVAVALQRLGKMESEFWDRLTNLPEAGRDSLSEPLSALITAFSGRRSLLRSQLLAYQQGALTQTQRRTNDNDFQGSLSQFLEADDLNLQAAWKRLIRCDPSSLCLELPRADKNSPRSLRLRTRAWHLLDLVVVEDLAELSIQHRPEDLTSLRILHLLVANCGEDRRFVAAWQALNENLLPRPELCEAAFLRCGVYATADDIGVMLRVLLVTTRDKGHRELAVQHISMASLWCLVAYNHAPWKALETICHRIQVGESESYGKAFFDSIHSRLREEITTLSSSDPDNYFVSLILALFRFDFFVQTSYFERIERLLRPLMSRGSATANLKKKLLKLRRDRGNSEDREDGEGKSAVAERRPSSRLDLPLGVHRYLAADPDRIHIYISFRDPRIAGEALKHVSLGNILKVLGHRSIHQLILHKILQRRDLFRNPAVTLAALNHPKCLRRFAQENLGKVPPMQVRKLAWSHQINPVVRALASAWVRRHTVQGQNANLDHGLRGHSSDQRAFNG